MKTATAKGYDRVSDDGRRVTGMTDRGAPPAAPPALVEKETVTALALIDDVDDNHLMVLVTGKDTVGILKYIGERIEPYHVNMERANAVRLGDRPAISLLLYSENARDIKALADDLRADKDMQIQGKRILPVKTYWLRILAPDQSGLMARVTRVLYNYDINLTGLAGTTHPAASATTLGYPYAGKANKIAAVKLRIEVPLHRLDEMEMIRARIEGLGGHWVVGLTETPERDLAPVWPGEYGRSCQTNGPLRYAVPG